MKRLIVFFLLLAMIFTLGQSAAATEIDRAFSVGNIVTFGAYEQDNNTSNGKEAIQWRVLARNGTKAMLISVYNLDCQPYDTSLSYDTAYEAVTWETCTLRKWLNDNFLNAAFTQVQRDAIMTSELRNDKKRNDNTSGDNVTQDKVFLVSGAELGQLFTNDADRIAKNTAYTKAQGAYTDDSGDGWWWIRSNGIYYDLAASVMFDGSYSLNSTLYGYGYAAVRPALYIDLSSYAYQYAIDNGLATQESSEQKDKEDESSQFRTLTVGSTGPDVAKLKQHMYELGYFRTNTVNETFTTTTAEYVREFETVNGLPADGIADPEMQALFFSDDAIPKP
jgi:hypothetical protein